MKKLFLVALLVISFSMIGFSQSITFEKFFSENAVNQVIQTDDNGYILNCSGELRFVKLDQFGYMQWAKHYPHIINPGKEISKTIDGGYLAIGSVMNQGYEDICLVKLDTNFDTVWTKTFGYLGEIGFAAIQLPDSSIIFSSRLGSGSRLRKINSDGDIIWAQTFSGGLVSLKSYLVNLNNDKFIFGLRYHIYLMNSDGDILWNRGVNYNSPTFLTMDGYIFISTTAYLEKLDLNMNTIWQKNISNIVSLTYSNEGAYTAIKSSLYSPSPCSLLKIDTSGNILSEISFEETGQYISTTSDSGFIICGSINRTYDYEKYVTWLLKTDNNLDYNSIAIKDPLDADRLNIFDTYAITWKAKNVSYIDIDYSIDNKVTWNNLALQYSAIEDTFYWTVPGLPLGNLFLRVRDSFNQEIFDISDPALIATSYSAFDYIAANEILMWLRNDGMNAHNPTSTTGFGGFLWPGGENATIPAIFQDGLVWGGKVNGETRVNGNTYRIGLIPGYILPSGLPSDPLDVKAKLFNIKKDWQSLPPGPRKSKYEFDYLNWPVDLGAPWDDNDGNGIYTPGIDNPRILGEETLFFVANDLNASRSTFTYGSNPIGLELQATTFGYNSELLKDVLFKKFKIINKSPDTITEMYFTYWADADLGNANDDFVGCDTLLNLGYQYNGDNNDEGYYGTPPPAVGHLIVQPPIVPAEPTDSARYGDGWKKGFRNIPINSFAVFMNGNDIYADPNFGLYSGTLQFYNIMQGLLWNGSPIIDPNNNLPTHFCVPGDPETGTGWYEGPGWPGGYPPEDRRYTITSGPFNMAPSDTQEIAIAFLMKKGTNNINSVTQLKNYAAQIQHWYDNDFVTDVEENNSVIPLEYSLSQNYPNPFNPSTSIQYAISSKQLVQLKVYDILGREIITLVNEEKPAGSYEVEFKSTVGSLQWASGIYFYRLQAGSFIQTKKMLLIK